MSSLIVTHWLRFVLIISRPDNLLAANNQILFSQLSYGGTGVVTSVIDGYTLILDKGRHVRLLGIVAPELPVGHPPFIMWPYAKQAQNFLAQLTVRQDITLYHDGRQDNRYNQILAYVKRNRDNLWIQAALLKAGLARVYVSTDHPIVAEHLYSFEKEARAAKRGIWRDRFYALRTPENAEERIDNFEIIEGQVLKAGRYRKTVYLDFTKNWREGFSVAIDQSAQKLFQKAGIDPLSLAGQHVRVRGWLHWKNGPRIVVTHPAQIERY